MMQKNKREQGKKATVTNKKLAKLLGVLRPALTGEKQL